MHESLQFQECSLHLPLPHSSESLPMTQVGVGEALRSATGMREGDILGCPFSGHLWALAPD